MRLHRLTITLTCLVFASACTDDTQDDAADEVGTESTSDESGSSETESGSSSEESSSTEAESESESASTTETADDPGTTETETTADESTTETETESTESTETTTSDTLDEESTSTTSDTGAMSCEEVEAAYEALVTNNTNCVLDEQCHVVDGHCWMGLGGCWYIVNDNVKQADLEELADAYNGFNCFGPVCACLPPPNNVGCIDGTCLSL